MTRDNYSKIYRSMPLIIAALATISFASLTPTFAQMSNNSSSSVSSSSSSLSMTMLNLGTPLFVEHNKPTNMTAVNQTTIKATFQGNGTFMLPTGNVSTIDSGQATIYIMHGFARANGKVWLKTTDGKENATVTFTEYMPDNSTIGIGTAFVQTNSSAGQQLAVVNNVIGVFRDITEPQMSSGPATGSTVTFWQWK
jgi:hypothetical protein